MAVGRFLSRDPYPVDTRNPRELNRYAYAANNPATFFDPRGLTLIEYGLIAQKAKVGAISGAIGGFAFSTFFYCAAILSGCGTEANEWAKRTNPFEYIAKATAMGAAIGAVAGGLAAAGGFGLAVVGVGGVGFGINTMLDAFEKQEGVCKWGMAAAGFVAVVGGAGMIGKGLSGVSYTPPPPGGGMVTPDGLVINTGSRIGTISVAGEVASVAEIGAVAVGGGGISSGGGSGDEDEDDGDPANVPQGEVTPTDLHAFGNKTQPRLPRIEGYNTNPGQRVDLELDLDGNVTSPQPQEGGWPTGASTFGDVNEAPLTNHYHVLPAGTKLPEGLAWIDDSTNTKMPTHHTIYPTRPMSSGDFIAKWEELPWKYGGKK